MVRAGSGDEDFSREAEDAQKALKAIQKRNGIVIENNYAEVARSIKIELEKSINWRWETE